MRREAAVDALEAEAGLEVVVEVGFRGVHGRRVMEAEAVSGGTRLPLTSQIEMMVPT